MKLLEPGNYFLTDDVQNTHPDKRTKRDWLKAVTFPKGLRLTVAYPPSICNEDEKMQAAHAEFCKEARVVYQLGTDCYSYSLKVGYGNEVDDLQYSVMLPYLEPLEKDLGQVFSENERLGFTNHSQRLLRYLVKQGVITPKDVEAGFAALKDMEGEEWSELDAVNDMKVG
jgi:hypothetical protein